MFVVIDIALAVLTAVFAFYSPESLNLVFVFATLVYIYLLVSWLNRSEGKLNYFTIILLLSYLYYFGQYLLNFLSIDITVQYTINNTFTTTQINSTALYVLINIIVLHGAILFFYKPMKHEHRLVTSSERAKAFEITIWIVLTVSFICEIIVLLFQIDINLKYGYTVALRTNYTGAGSFSYIINFFSTLYMPALFAALVVTKNKRSNIIVWITYAVFLICYFMSGSRFEAVVSIAGVILLYHYYYKRLSLKTVAIVLVVGIAVLYLSSLLSNIRVVYSYESTRSTQELLAESIEKTNEDNFITDSISEAGMQILSVTTVYNNCPENEPFTYGAYYLGGALRVIPNLFGGDNPLITADINTIFTKYFTKTYGMGSSFIIEAYYNFGWFGILMMIPFGWLAAYVVKKMQRVRTDKNIDLILTYFIFYIASTSFFWIRSDARNLLREIVFYYFGFRVATWIVQGIIHYRTGGFMNRKQV